MRGDLPLFTAGDLNLPPCTAWSVEECPESVARAPCMSASRQQQLKSLRPCEMSRLARSLILISSGLRALWWRPREYQPKAVFQRTKYADWVRANSNRRASQP